jgi:hypothetical protein
VSKEFLRLIPRRLLVGKFLLGRQYLWNVCIRIAPDLQEPLICGAGLLALILSLVGQGEMIMRQWITRIELKDALIFSDGFIESAEPEIGIGKTVFQRV